MAIESDAFHRVVAAKPADAREEAFERALRPRMLDEYVGQEKVRGQLSIFIEAARKRNEALDHVLLFGPPGLGKTTLSHIVAHELGVNLRQTSGPVLERPGDLAALLTNLEPRDVLFIDEIHRLSPIVEEILYPALEDFQIDIMIGEGPAARSVKLDLPPFTLVGATTRAGMLTNPLRDRFGIVATAMGDLQSQETSNPSSVSQYAAVAALEGPQQCVADMLGEFAKRRDYVKKRIAALPGVTCPDMAGAFYAFMNISKHLGRTYGGAKVTNSTEWCLALLEQHNVATVMGSSFGAEGYARVSFATSLPVLEAGFDRIATFLKSAT